jgi:hypothetical protein
MTELTEDEMANEEIEISARALEDMRDVLEELGYVNAQYAKADKVIARIKQKFGLENWLRHYGHL